MGRCYSKGGREGSGDTALPPKGNAAAHRQPLHQAPASAKAFACSPVGISPVLQVGLCTPGGLRASGRVGGRELQEPSWSPSTSEQERGDGGGSGQEGVSISSLILKGNEHHLVPDK